MMRISLIVFVQDGVHHDGLSVDSENRVCWYIYPVFCASVVSIGLILIPLLLTSFESERLTSYKNNICPLVLAFHLILPVIRRSGLSGPLSA